MNSVTQDNPAGTTFWLAPGTHTLGSGPFDQVIAKTNNVYIGAPGAVLDGQGLNVAAFTGTATGVKVRYLTVQNFVSPDDENVVNQSGAASWTVEYSTIRNNRGGGIRMGDDNVVRYNCITGNSQYGITAWTPNGSENITVDHNELANNPTHDYGPTCGCSGATKFWSVRSATITNNWVHHNHAPGLWADMNNVDFVIEGNYLNDNDEEAIFYEVSYNASIKNNTLKRNALVKGRKFAERGDTFPVGAIYVSESGGDSRISDRFSTFEVSGNVFEDNWGGVVLWEGADRFCNTASPSTGYCPLAPAASVSNCVAGTINNEPYFSDCRWRTQNVWVHHNDFHIDKVALACVGTQCGQNGLISNRGTSPEWSPYKGYVVPELVTFQSNNRFTDNRYSTWDWKFNLYDAGQVVDAETWQSAPYSQDVGSSIPPPPLQANALDADTSGLEGSVGRWTPWYAVSIIPTTGQAHTGLRSLQVDLTASLGWGVTLNNWPGFATKPRPKTISFWAKSGVLSGPTATLRVKWRDAAGSDLRTDTLTTPELKATWQQVSAAVTAPTGTAWVALELVATTGAAASILYFDDFVVADSGSTTTTTTTTTPTTTTTIPSTTTTIPSTTTTTTVPSASSNALDSNTSRLERSLGTWAPWYSSAVSRTTPKAHTGTHSLKVRVNASDGWGVITNNWPGFATTAGTKTLRFWAKSAEAGPTATLRVKWRDSAGSDLATDELTTTLRTTWQKAATTVVVPAGTASVALELVGTGTAGSTLYFDDFVVG